ncbi:XTP/dITP diphosphohydrolase [Bathymodiolus platifrons methanotrophic gill symbiont]|uniref:RdgB/HAM1 family non-canonical purine NTP pyrophosphatase n=1 Tax=Bathymodiolus platifrons methanotrophic gill symbiont TaxID=113268 RepID=UPI0011C8A14F|nr:RdgB/HAM1 family non-canonical purine NTP pyrophosphatase [Bathymodiolus platifrons methanotrophic gill symbiont]TXK93473.1 non-canonical purine NTP pyrophosphatase, RdgB/HAM1 family [Methylococcaceae bacterium CS5]TXK96606.1 non-canonical purine NTP pyrophosphatase, RdgB/HAM1 family [Methylococcaceae bacterium CS4]TXL02457.1 non-canonical purine NTP pyrophosphatase, RdgB/HAM1 family [Methylococcaceae bacterium CS1]TXL07267.1 non-canonical purine NTP pyrophosphatase, RdgB/HAM1 family [Methyl
MSFLNSEKIVLVSGNSGKIKEIQTILSTSSIVPQQQFNIQEAEETGSTFIENAIIKARNAALHSNLPAIADDSGLIVDALKGAPGVISARYAGAQATDQENLQKLLDDMVDIPESQRSAQFVCVIVLMRHANDPFPLISQGSWEGSILNHTRGSNGFGYDPVFWLAAENCSSAELSAQRKNQLSHRGQALRQLAGFL